MTRYTPINPKFDRLPLLTDTQLASDAMDFRADMQYIRQAGAALLNRRTTGLPDMWQATSIARNFNPDHAFWPVDVAGQYLAAWRRR